MGCGLEDEYIMPERAVKTPGFLPENARPCPPNMIILDL
jgi:hypothetical protein